MFILALKGIIMTEIISEKILYSQHMQIQEGTIRQSLPGGATNTYTRWRLNRQDAAVVLVHNTETNTVVLVKQFRYAIAGKVKEPILELVAGKIDEGEQPLDAAIREAREECGYRIRPDQIRLVSSFFVSPGYTSEKFYLFHATVTNADRLSAGGGLEEEHEYLEVIELDYDRFKQMAAANEFEDGKTLMAALYLS